MKTTFDHFFGPIFPKHFSCLLQKLEVDKYVKKLTVTKFIILMIFAQLEKLSCLREISNSLSNENLSRAIGLKAIIYRA